MRTPLDALRARTSVAAARVGLLTTYARHPSGQTSMTVSVRPQADGSVDVQLGRDAVAARQLLARPVATLDLAPVGHEPVLLHGAVQRLPGVGPTGALLFHLEVAAVLVGSPAVAVERHHYAEATPEALSADAPAVLAHVNGVHADGLAACLRALGHEVDFAHATALDGDGLTVTAVTTSSVTTVRLPFLQPVTALSQLPVSLSLLLAPRCHCSTQRPGPGGGDGREP